MVKRTRHHAHGGDGSWRVVGRRRGLHWDCDFSDEPAGASSIGAEQPLSLPAIRIVPSATTLPATQPTTMTIDQVIAGVQHGGEGVHESVHQGFSNDDRRDAQGRDRCGSRRRWSVAGSAWYDGDALGKQRVYFSETRHACGARARRYVVGGAEVDFSWDGRDGHEVNVAGGVAGQRTVARQLGNDHARSADAAGRLLAL